MQGASAEISSPACMGRQDGESIVLLLDEI